MPDNLAPGVYFSETSAVPSCRRAVVPSCRRAVVPSGIAPVETAIPVFIGYTAKVGGLAAAPLKPAEFIILRVTLQVQAP